MGPLPLVDRANELVETAGLELGFEKAHFARDTVFNLALQGHVRDLNTPAPTATTELAKTVT